MSLIRNQELLRTIKFTLFSISAGGIQIASEVFFKEVCNLNYWIAYAISLTLSVIWNFTFNRKYTFKSASNVPVAMVKVFMFYLVFAPLSIWWTAVLTEAKYGIVWNGYVVMVGTMLINFITEYIYDRFVVFGKSIDTAIAEK